MRVLSQDPAAKDLRLAGLELFVMCTAKAVRSERCPEGQVVEIPISLRFDGMTIGDIPWIYHGYHMDIPWISHGYHMDRTEF